MKTEGANEQYTMSDKKDNSISMPDWISDYFVMTLNGKGPVTAYLDQYAMEFIHYATQQTGPVLELGAAYGFLTIQTLKEGGTVIANDLDPRHLQILYNQTPATCRNRLTLLPGEFPGNVNLSPQSIAGCYVARMLGYLEPGELQKGLEKIFTWLQSEKKLFIISAIPYSFRAIFKNIVSIYEQRVNENIEWPGYFTNLKQIVGGNYVNYGPNVHHFLDGKILTRELERVGFIVETVEVFARKDLPEWALGDGRDAVAVIARKP